MDNVVVGIAVAVVVVAIVVALSTVSDRLGIAPPLIIMLVGAGVSFLPFLKIPVIRPEWILVVVLPPLLYAAAISIPTVDLRRDFAAVGGLAVLLVGISSAVFGLVIHWLIPDISLPLGVALGAILSPTDAAAITIVKRLGVPARVGLILQGESLLNDATALVLLRSAIAATAASVSVWGVVSSFVWAALAAAGLGCLTGWAGVRIRRLIHQPAPSTAISLMMPFVSYVPAELIHASGFVAVVAAGITAAQLAPRQLEARQRIADRENWHTVEFLLEGAVFLAIGLELYALVVDVRRTRDTLGEAVGIAGLAVGVILVIRWVFATILVRQTTAFTNRRAQVHDRLRRSREAPEPARLERRERMIARISGADEATQARWEKRRETWRTRIRRYVADVDYLMRQPLGFREGTLIAWAGMRGVVTLAAAQTLPLGTPHRSLLILVAFFVAAGSLVLQGGTLPWAIRLMGLAGQNTTPEGEWPRLKADLDKAGNEFPVPPDTPAEQAKLLHLYARRDALLHLRSAGAYSSHSLASALAELDAEEIGIQIRLAQAEYE